MSRTKKKREERMSSARRRALHKKRGFQTTTISLPEGVGFYELKPGTHKIEILPYVAGKGNPWAEKGELHFERTFFIYRQIGPSGKNYVALAETFNKPDPIQEFCAAEARKPDPDTELLKSLQPKERQLFLIYDHSQSDKGIQLLEISYHLFGKLLDSRIETSVSDDEDELNWDQFFFPGTEGSTLKITVEEKSWKGGTYQEVIAIDFLPRKKPLPKKLADHGICLDDLIVETPYDQLKAAFLGTETAVGDVSDEKDGSDSETTYFSDENALQTAFDLGIEEGLKVVYDGREMEVIRISKDGSFLTLLDDNDEIFKSIDPSDVKLITDLEKGPEDLKGKVESEMEDVEKVITGESDNSLDDDWDADWD